MRTLKRGKQARILELGLDLRSLGPDYPISYSSGSQTAVCAGIAGKAA